MSNSETRINVRVTPGFKEKVTKYIDENNLSLTDLVTQSIENTINSEKNTDDSKVSTLELLVKSMAHNLENVTSQLNELKVKSQA